MDHMSEIHSGQMPVVQLVGPLPPLRTGIAGYLKDLLLALGGAWPVAMCVEPGSDMPEIDGLTRVDYRDLRSDLPLISHIGNSELHPHAYAAVREHGGVVVLHDVVLAHARFVHAVQAGRVRQFLEEAERLYGSAGSEIVERLRRGLTVEQIERFPFVESVVEEARAIVVHNTFARALVEQRGIDVPIHEVPMGVPLPPMIDRELARQALGIPTSAFVIASVTHINPYKRLDVVLRALRRLVPRVPEAILVVAGSSTPHVSIRQIAWTLGIDDRVRTLGYVDDLKARMLASAADVCVNLRHPNLGETSASLLRLLGAGRPVIVTEGPMSSDLPSDVAIPVPVGKFEVEILSDVLHLLAEDSELRDDTGRASRAYVEHRHSMREEIAGYARVLESVYNQGYPEITPPNMHEPQISPNLIGPNTTRLPGAGTIWWPGKKTVEAAADLGLTRDLQFLKKIARRNVELGLDRTVALDRPDFVGQPQEDFTGRLICPICRQELVRTVRAVRCAACKRSYEAGSRIADLRPNRGE